VARVLVAMGADPSIPDADGVTALEHARARGHDEIVGLLS
jgi:ankyrin repeat protein